MKDQENLLDNFINKMLTDFRIQYLPLMWDEAIYHDQGVDLHFSVFDPYHQFNPQLSVLKVNHKEHLFNHQRVEDFIKISLTISKATDKQTSTQQSTLEIVEKFINKLIDDKSLTEKEFQNVFAKVNFNFYPNNQLDNWRQSWFVPLFIDKIKIPNSKRLLRVIGDTRSSSYLVGGADQAMKISLVLGKYLKLSLKKNLDVLDWGCGCGRISQFLAYFDLLNLVGADIDQDNIQWCKDNIEKASFTSIPYYPQTDFADESFDVVIGISVMTHLTEDTHKAWLQEIKRILRPGGFALLSVRGPVYYHLAKELSNKVIAEIERDGYLDLLRDPALDQVITEKEYYRATFCSRSYIRSVWSQYFQVINILDGLVLQDVVILQKP